MDGDASVGRRSVCNLVMSWRFTSRTIQGMDVEWNFVEISKIRRKLNKLMTTLGSTYPWFRILEEVFIVHLRSYDSYHIHPINESSSEFRSLDITFGQGHSSRSFRFSREEKSEMDRKMKGPHWRLGVSQGRHRPREGLDHVENQGKRLMLTWSDRWEDLEDLVQELEAENADLKSNLDTANAQVCFVTHMIFMWSVLMVGRLTSWRSSTNNYRDNSASTNLLWKARSRTSLDLRSSRKSWWRTSLRSTLDWTPSFETDKPSKRYGRPSSQHLILDTDMRYRTRSE